MVFVAWDLIEMHSKATTKKDLKLILKYFIATNVSFEIRQSSKVWPGANSNKNDIMSPKFIISASL